MEKSEDYRGEHNQIGKDYHSDILSVLTQKFANHEEINGPKSGLSHYKVFCGTENEDM